MKITATQIRYLLSIYQLCKNGVVRSSDIADSLEVSRPSAHRMVDQLLKMNLIVKEQHSCIRFTEESLELAEQYYKGFLHISRFLHECFVLPKDTAEDGALTILSGLTITKVKELCMRMNEC